MESNGSYGSKIQTLVRHLLHIQLVDPGAKSIVFSAWVDSLRSKFVELALQDGLSLIVFQVVEHALQSNGKSKCRVGIDVLTGIVSGIPCMRLDQNRGKTKGSGAKRFRVDPGLQVLLLHGYVSRDLI